MKTTVASAALLIGTAASLANAQATDTPATRPVTLPRAEQFDLVGKTGKPYRISLAWPAEKPPASGYATLYVLDANTDFATAVEAVRFQQGNVPCVVVGIGYPQEKLDMARRYWDYTPYTVQEHIAIRKLNRGSEGFVEPSGTGGQDEFYGFLTDTLRPVVEQRFPTDPNRRVIFGHSLSARFVLHVLATKPEAFSHYAAASPSIWWDDRSVMAEIDAYLTSDAKRPAGVQITVGEYEQKPSPTATPDRAAFFAAAKMVNNARETAERLKAAGVNTQFVLYPDENHGSVVPAALARAVRFGLAAATTRPAR